MQLKQIARRSDRTIVQVCRGKLAGKYFLVEPPDYSPNGQEIPQKHIRAFINKHGFDPVPNPTCKNIDLVRNEEEEYRRPLREYFARARRSIEAGKRPEKSVLSKLDKYPST